MPYRVEKLGNTETSKVHPAHNMLIDHTLLNQQGPGKINFGNSGLVKLEQKTSEANFGNSFFTASILSHYTHWFSGGEFTVNYSGIPGVVFSNRGTGALLGTFSEAGKTPYYKLSQVSVKPDIVPTTEEPFIEQRGGQPLDAIHGDQGYSNLDGYFYGILSGGPAFMRANPFSQIEFFDMENLVRLSSQNYIHYTGQGQQKISTNSVKKLTNNSVEGSISGEEPFEFFSNLGSIGNLYSFYSKDNYLQLASSGETYNKSKTGIYLSVGTVPVIEKPHNKFNPDMESKEDEKLEEEKPFNWQNSHRVTQQGFYTENFFYKTYKNNLSKSTDINLDRASIHVRDDKSVNIMSFGGSTIEMTSDGDIIISPRRNLVVSTGSSVNILAGNELNLVSRNSNHLRSTDGDVYVTAKKKLQNYSDDGILLEAKTDVAITSTETKLRSTNYFNNCTGTRSVQSSSSVEEAITKQENYQTNISDITHIRHTGRTIHQKITNSYLIRSNTFHWAGGAFTFSGSQAGILMAAKPIRINHVHQKGIDKWKVAACKKGCTVVRIETPKSQASSPNINIPEVEEVATPETLQVNFTETKTENSSFSLAPWQYQEGGKWTSLEDKIKGITVFPNTYSLFKYDGKSVVEIPWSGYTIKG